MGKRLLIFTTVSTLVAMVVTTAALAYTHSGPFYDSSYNPQVWNYGIGVGNVSPTQSADFLGIPSNLAPGFEEAGLRDLGTALEGEAWTVTPTALALIGTDSFGSLKLTTGISTRLFTISGNLGVPTVNSQLAGEGLCGSVVEWSPSPAIPACMGTSYGYNSNGYLSWGLPPGTTTFNYAVLAFQFSSGCSTTEGAGAQASVDLVFNPSDAPAGTNASKLACATAVWNAYQTFGNSNLLSATTNGGTFVYGNLHYLVTSPPVADCKQNEFLAWGGAVGASAGTHCYIAYAIHSALQLALEHTLPVIAGSQSSVVSRSLSPALSSTPNPTFLSRVRTFVDNLSQAYTDEWNCILDATYVACPTATLPPTPVPGGCFTSPEPGGNESFADYRLRIQNDGYTGTFVEVNDPNYPVGGAGYPDNSDAASLSVGTATGVGSMGSGGSVTMAYVSSTGKRVSASSWRGAYICPATTTEVDIYDVPSSPGGTGGGVTTLPSIDFTPITSVNYGTAFPFGVFTWISNQFDAANCDSRTSCNFAPTFTLTRPEGGTIFVNLTSPTWVSTWRSPVFDVLEFLITLGAIWFLSFRVLGIGGGSTDE